MAEVKVFYSPQKFKDPQAEAAFAAAMQELSARIQASSDGQMDLREAVDFLVAKLPLKPAREAGGKSE
jgi:hypothetical protein